jgi:hypothetical protein
VRVMVGGEAHALAERAGGGAHGWNIDEGSPSGWAGPSTPASLFGGWGLEGVGSVWGVGRWHTVGS